MCNRASWFIALGCFFVAVPPKLQSQESELDKLLQGDWVVASRVIKGKTDAHYIGGTLSLTENERSEFKFSSGDSMILKVSRKVHDEKAKTFRFTIETPEDSEGMGGGGPRKGLCKVNEKGELEILEGRSASHEFPIDFSDATKGTKIYWKLTKPSGSTK